MAYGTGTCRGFPVAGRFDNIEICGFFYTGAPGTAVRQEIYRKRVSEHDKQSEKYKIKYSKNIKQTTRNTEAWPRCLALSKDSAKLEIAKDYYRQIIQKDIIAIDGVKRNPEWTRALLWSYARNMATTAKRTSIYADVKATQNVTDVTLASYIDVLEALFVIKDIDAWTPQIRSKTAIRSAKKHIFVDPSIGLAALGINPEYFRNDLDLFGHAFENVVLRDLLVYAENHNARVLHYTDDMGLEADAVYQMEDGRYALIEIKTGANKIPEAEKSLLRFKDAIRKHNEGALKNVEHPRAVYREPSALIVICANAPMAYTTDNGVKIVPVGCLKD